MTLTQDLEQHLTALQTKLKTGSEATQLQIIQELAALDDGIARDGLQPVLDHRARQILMDFLSEQVQTSPVAAGKAYAVLLPIPEAAEFLQRSFSRGIVPLRSESGLDYQPLQQLLARKQFQAADQLTLELLCQLAGPAAVRRKWLYFTEVDRFPIPDLQTIDRLWWVHSEGKFGFSVQRQLWLGVGQNWEALWPKIAWKSGNKWTRYPQEFIWDVSAPKGHLPLSNQLRGVQVLNALLLHPAWTTPVS